MKKFLPLFVLVLAVAACQPQPAVPTATLVPPIVVTVLADPTAIPPTATPEPATALPSPTTEDPPIALPSVFQFTPPDGGTVIYDFADHLCEAKWTNNGRSIPCPGTDPNDPEGYVNLVDKPQLGNIIYDNAAILGVPAHGQLIGLFGRFPSLTVQKGDTFITSLDCLNENCNVEFSLGYYANGTFAELPGVWTVVNAKGPFPIKLSLDALAGQTVDFTLVMRNQDVAATEQTLWIQPIVWRPNAP